MFDACIEMLTQLDTWFGFLWTPVTWLLSLLGIPFQPPSYVDWFGGFCSILGNNT
jgi:hypothetical protein